MARRRRRIVLVLLVLLTVLGGLVSPAYADPAATTSVADQRLLTAQAPTAAGYLAITPSRVLDTRSAGAGQTAGLSTVSVQLAGKFGLPSGNIRAVVVNLTVTNAKAAGYLTAYSSGVRPVASSVNFQSGQTVANLATVPVASNGTITVFNGAPAGVDLIVDVQGYFAGTGPLPPGGFTPVDPRRLLDTRSTPNSLGPTASVRVSVRGVPGAPTGPIGAALINLTVTEPRADGYLLAFDGGLRPLASSLNYRAGQTVANTAVVPVAADGTIEIANDSIGAAHVIVDVQGYYLGGTPTLAGAFLSIGPRRVVDTRVGTGASKAPLAGMARLNVRIADNPGLPAKGISAVAINLTVVNARADGYLTAAADGRLPTASSVNFTAGRTVANMVVVPVAPDGSITIHSGSPGGTDIIVDVLGYYRISDAVDEWPSQFGDLGNNKINLGEKTLTAATAANVLPSWTTATGDDPVARNGVVYSTGFNAGRATGLVARDAATGAVRWFSSYPEGSWASDGPLLLTESAVIVSYNSRPLIKLVAVSISDGRVLWTSTVPNSVDSTCGDITEMTADAGRLIVLKCRGEVQSFDLRTGAPGWFVVTLDEVAQSLANHVTLSNGRLYVSFLGGHRGTEVWDPTIHAVLWAYPTRATLPTVIADGRVLVPLQYSFNDQIEAYPTAGCGAARCAPLWVNKVAVPDGSRTTLAVVNGALGDEAFVVAVGESNTAWLAPIDLSTGTIGRWWSLGKEDSDTSGYRGITRFQDSLWMLADDELRAYPATCGDQACPALVRAPAPNTTTVLHDHVIGASGGTIFVSRGTLDVTTYRSTTETG